MEYLSLGEMKRLALRQGEPSVSIYMPAHRHHPETDQDPIRFGNQLREIESKLAERSMRSPDIASFLAPARALLEDSHFWRHQQDGLAVFMDGSEFDVYRLPFSVDERTVVADRVYLSPLLPLFTNNGHFYILALSQNEVRLFEGTRFTVGAIDLPVGAPRSLAEVVPVEEDPGLQVRSTGSPGSGASMYHGHDGGGSAQRMRIAQYLNELDKSLLPLLKESAAPLVIAGDVQLLPIYREVTNYAQVVSEGPRGNPEQLSSAQLHAEAWPYVEGHFRKVLDEAVGRYMAQAGTGRTGATLEEVVPAAVAGRVDTLLVVPGLEVWGAWQPEPLRVVRGDAQSEGSLELEGFAAAQTLLNGGTVLAAEAAQMPENAEVAAIYRY